MWVVTGATLIAAFAVTPSALAQAEGDEATDADQIVLHGELVVAEGETVDSAVIFDGPATVDGTVSEALVVFNGRVEITGTVHRDVVVFNGDVVVRSGARIDGDLATRGTTTVEEGAVIGGEQRSIATGTDWADVGFAGRFAWWVAYSISTLILGLILLLVAPRVDPAVAWAGRERTGAAIGIGLAVFILLPIVAVLLLVTIVGIPLGLFLLLALSLLYTAAYVLGAHAIGRRVIQEPKSRYVAFLAGWAIVRVLGLIPIVGGLAWTLVTIFGFGVMLTAARRTGQRATVPTMPPAPLPAT